MQNKYIWISEILWWTGSVLAGIVVVWPYYPALIVEVPFLVPNLILVVLAIQCFRLTFLLRLSVFALNRWIIFLLCFAFIPIGMYAVRQYSEMSQFFTTSSNWMHSFSYLMTLSEKSELASYIRIEFTWCAVIAFMAGIAMSGKMFVTSWRILGDRGKF